MSYKKIAHYTTTFKGGLMTQREAVYNATKAVLKENAVQFEDGDNIADVMTDELRKSIMAIVVEGFKNGEVELKDTPSNQEKLASDSKLNSYVSGLVSNWFRKDKRFNGNTKYVAKNPGSRTGQSDSKLKALRNLKKMMDTKGQDSTEVDAYIEARVNELAAEKAKKIEVDFNEIPAELKESLGIE